jgi:maltooligosyltrehalose trehalohydrolase
MEAAGDGYFEAMVHADTTGWRYTYALDGDLHRPDPASRLQEQGVHGPSTVVGGAFDWRATSWRGLPLRDYILYELHVGAFTPEGTLDAAIQRIPYLKELGITAVELMPLAQFPGERNWGYDGVFPYAVQHSYGGPDALKRFVDACHLEGLAVVLDVVYNHLGPEGNYLRDFGPYFTNRHHTPWGDAINYDGADSGPVRHYFIENALYWVTEFRIDALRLDATDTIYDTSPRHFLAELSERMHERAEVLNRRIYAIAESAANDVRWIQPRELGGFALDAQWNDDFHHALRHALAGDVRGCFQDYQEFRHLARTLSEGFAYQGEYSGYRRRHHGSDSRGFSPSQFVVCCQNHDQVGNRMMGDRLGQRVSLAKQRLAAAWTILSPYIPLLFMGEEYNEQAPFPYFVSHGDPELVAAVRQGRRREFAAFAWEGEPPDPQGEATFASAKLNPELRQRGDHAALYETYRTLIRLRKSMEPLAQLSREGMLVLPDTENRVVWVSRRFEGQECVLAFCFGEEAAQLRFPFESGLFRKRFDSASIQAEGHPDEGIAHAFHQGESVRLEPFTAVLYERTSRTTATEVNP